MDKNPLKISSRELELLRELYHIPDEAEFQLLEPSDQPTRPFLNFVDFSQGASIAPSPVLQGGIAKSGRQLP